MRLNQLLTILSLFIISSIHAQPRCGFDPVHKSKLKTDPAYKVQIEKESEKIRQLIKLRSAYKIQPLSATATYIIPVVVHVVHTGGAVGTIYNPSDAQIEGAIDYLNSIYSGTFSGVQGVGDMKIQFALAQRDPNCNPTNGINRVNGSSIANYTSGGVGLETSLGTNEINVKSLIRWPATQYYNIWVVNKIDGNDGTSGSFVAGYAYFPGASALIDGTVMLATQTRSGAKTLPHEMGHALSLYHPFEGYEAACGPAETDCSIQGDEVCDTDPITQPTDLTTCRTGNNPCTGTPYSINTESNFMNYTSCYTLFTAGQRNRAWAAMSLASRSSLTASLGGTPPNAGTTTCIPKINFEFADDQQTEVTANTNGCRSYKDYTYNMVVGNTPSATATAILTLGGTATEGVDYDISTNGSFTTPSKIVNFPAGSTSSQPFTIRVYNDAIVDGTETVTLSFTVNSGGGNAVVGDGRPTFTLSITDDDVLPVSGSATGNATVGTAAFTSTNPFNASQQKLRLQFLYKASELIAAGIPAGQITGISLNLVKHSARAFSNFSIKAGSTSVTYLVNGGVTVPANTVIKTLNSYSTVNGWNDFDFDTPFTWDGTSSIVFEICFDNGSTATDAADEIQLTTDAAASASQGNMFIQTGINCSEAFTSVSYYGSGIKPVIKFNYGIPSTQVQTTLNASKQEYLGPFADIYFYDQTDNKLLARIKNLTSHDFGCTTVQIDRSGSSARSFTTSSTSQYLLDKTFKIIPTNNNASGQYDITLYYSDAEKTGWEAATGQSWNNILLVKVPSQISNYSPGTPTPDGAGVVITTTPTKGTLGSQYSLTSNFTNGFSGFGAGIPTIPLPITLLNFDGKIDGMQVKLNWTTSFEQNMKNFVIEKSTNGLQFTKIGTVNAAGNSSINRNYSFNDGNLSMINYYRLKMNELDGTNTYSKVISFKFNEVLQNTWLERTIIKDHIKLRLSKDAQRMALQLVDNKGNIIVEKQALNVSTNYSWPLPNYLASGVYILRATVDGQLFTFKVIKE